MTVLRSIVLHGPDDWKAVTAFVREHAGEAVQRRQPLMVTVARFRPPRTPGSNRYMWGAVLQQISQQACVHGRYFCADTWNEHAKRKFLPERSASGKDKWAVIGDGDLALDMSTSDLNSEEMALYLEQLQAYATTELGVVFDEAHG